MDKFMTPAQVAELLGMKQETLRKRRFRGVGPKFVRLGSGPNSRCAYRESDVAAFIAELPTFMATGEEKAAWLRSVSEG